MEFQWINLLPTNWVQALYLTLFHSLWIGFGVALLTSVIMLSTKNSRAEVRYNLLTSLLFVFLIIMAIVFSLSFNSVHSLLSLAKENTSGPVSQNIGNDNLLNNLLSSINRITVFWSSYAVQIVLIWFLILCIKSVCFFIGINGIYNLKHKQVFDAGNFWENRVRELSQKLGISTEIAILQSSLAKTPMVVGHFKPLILIPLGLLNNLSTTQVEAILAHELAHVKRRDYLINMIQSFIEIVFFFNPAVWWLSNLIKEERENCCDDLALRCTNDKQEYIKALISCQEYNLTQPTHAMAITGRKNQLLGRVRRMVSNHRTTLNKMEKAILSITLISAVILSIACTNAGKKDIKQEVKKLKLEKKEIAQDTTKKKQLKAVTIKKKAAGTKSIKEIRIEKVKTDTLKLKLAKTVAIKKPQALKLRKDTMVVEILRLDTTKMKQPLALRSVIKETEVSLKNQKPLNIKLRPVQAETLKVHKTIELRSTEVEIKPLKPKSKLSTADTLKRAQPIKLKLSPTKAKPASEIQLKSAIKLSAPYVASTNYIKQRIETLKNDPNRSVEKTELLAFLDNNLKESQKRVAKTKNQKMTPTAKLPTEAQWTALALTKKREVIEQKELELKLELAKLTTERVKVDSSINSAIRRNIEADIKKARELQQKN